MTASLKYAINVACRIPAQTYLAFEPIGKFQMLSREKGHRSGSRPEAAGLFPPNVFGAREGSVNRSWWAVRKAKDAATIRPTKIPATRARLTRIRAAFPFAYILGARNPVVATPWTCQVYHR